MLHLHNPLQTKNQRCILTNNWDQHKHGNNLSTSFTKLTISWTNQSLYTMKDTTCMWYQQDTVVAKHYTHCDNIRCSFLCRKYVTILIKVSVIQNFFCEYLILLLVCKTWMLWFWISLSGMLSLQPPKRPTVSSECHITSSTSLFLFCVSPQTERRAFSNSHESEVNQVAFHQSPFCSRAWSSL